jgi:hypothetical protein
VKGQVLDILCNLTNNGPFLHAAIFHMPFRVPNANQFTVGTKLRHYKGGLYVVVGTYLIEASLKPGVLYKALQGGKQDLTWMRPMSEFQDMVTTVDGSVPRFVLVSESA